MNGMGKPKRGMKVVSLVPIGFGEVSRCVTIKVDFMIGWPPKTCLTTLAGPSTTTNTLKLELSLINESLGPKPGEVRISLLGWYIPPCFMLFSYYYLAVQVVDMLSFGLIGYCL